MSNFADFLDEIERLAYKILLWILLLPKTLLKIILEPQWVPGYVKEELAGDRKDAFDRYMSPVVVFLLVTLLPTLLYSFIPTPGMTVSQPTPYYEDDNRFMTLTTDATFISSTARVYHKVWWEVWQVDQVDRAGNPIDIEYGYDSDRSLIYMDQNGQKYENPTFTFVYAELHDEIDGVKPYTYSDSGDAVLDAGQLYPSEIALLDNNTIEDYFYYPFGEGEYQVRVTVENYDPNNGNLIESFSDTIYTTVPADAKADIYFDSPTMVSGDGTSAATTDSGLNLESLQGSLESGGTYLMALGLLSLPLLFSFGTKILGEDGLGETSLKNSFYMQCYYFSPVTAVFWASIYTFNLYTSDIYFFAEFMSLVVLGLIFIWFCFAEVRAITIERGVSTGRAWGIFIVLLLALVIGSVLIIYILGDLDFLRRNAIALYPVAAVIVTVLYFIRRRRERLANKQKVETVEA